MVRIPPCVGLTKKEASWKVGVSGVPWLYTDTRLCSTVALLTLPDDRVKSSTSKGLDKERKTRLFQKGPEERREETRMLTKPSCGDKE